MKRGCLWLGLGVACLVVGPLDYWSSIPRIGSATPAEVLALIPRELREEPPRDLNAEARFQAFKAIPASADGHAFSPQTVRRLKALVAAGPWRVPPGPKGDHEGPALHLEEELAHPIVQAARQGDRKACAAAVRFALSLVQRFDGAGGDYIDAAEVGEIHWHLADIIDKALLLHGLEDADRKSLRTLVPSGPEDRPAADAMVRDFRCYTLPRLLRVARGPKELQGLVDELAESDEEPLPPTDPGTFDPLETTRLMVRFAQADQAACLGRHDPSLPFLVHALREGLPTEPPPASGAIRAFLYRCAANHGRNTIGRGWTLLMAPSQGAELRDRRAKWWLRIRTALSAP